MARKKKGEIVNLDEVREEMAQAPVEGEAESGSEIPDGEEAQAEAVNEEQENGEEPAESTETEAEAAPDVNNVADPEDVIKVISDEYILRCRISDHELVEYSNTMIEALDEAKIADQRAKGFAAECKAERERALERFDEAKAIVRSKHEDRPVKCDQIHNYTRGMVYTRRQDTNEIFQRRKLMPWEQQMDIEEIASRQAEPGAEDATEAQADSDATEADEECAEGCIEEGQEEESEGDLAGVGADSEIEG